MSNMECVLDSRQYGPLCFARRADAALPVKIAAAVGMAAATGLLAQVSVLPSELLARVGIVLPFTPVPITGQVFSVLLAGALLGRSFGALSMGMYVGLGVAGIPWLAGGVSGFPLASGGYLIGFIPAALFVGWISRFPAMRRYLPMVGAMTIAAGIIYLVGVAQLAAVMRIGPVRAIQLGAFPFVPGEIVKIVLAAGIATSAMRLGRQA